MAYLCIFPLGFLKEMWVQYVGCDDGAEEQNFPLCLEYQLIP